MLAVSPHKHPLIRPHIPPTQSDFGAAGDRDEAPELALKGVTGLSLTGDVSGAELLQREAPSALLFKAFNTTGFGNMQNPVYPSGRAIMFVAGPDGKGKQTGMQLVTDVGFDAVDAGDLTQARLLEPLACSGSSSPLPKGSASTAPLCSRGANSRLSEADISEGVSGVRFTPQADMRTPSKNVC